MTVNIATAVFQNNVYDSGSEQIWIKKKISIGILKKKKMNRYFEMWKDVLEICMLFKKE